MPATTCLSHDPDLASLVESVTDYCERALPPRRLRALRAAGQDGDDARWREMAELGWCALVVPAARNGLDLGPVAAALVARALGRVVAPEPFIESGLGAANLLARLDPQNARLAALVDGSTVYSLPLARAAWQVPCVVLRDGALHGTVDHLPLGRDAARFLLPITTTTGRRLACLARGETGLVLEEVLLADGTTDVTARLAGVPCTPATLLDGTLDDALVEETFTLVEVAAAAYLLGLGEALFDATLAHLLTRRQFGRPLGAFQALQHRAVDLYLALRLTGAGLRTALDGAPAPRAADTGRALARARATAMLVVREAIQMHGAIGYTEACDVSLHTYRALVLCARYAECSAPATATVDASAPPAATIPGALPLDYRPADGDWNALDNDSFRYLVERWVATHYPPALRHYPGQVRWADIRPWHQALVDRGWAAPAWPREHGGMALAPDKLIVFIDALERHGVARAPDQGIVMVGPILFRYGSDAQRARFLGPALTGEHIWCQGYSEPNAGSDLAALATRAVLDGDSFVVNGQKIWTTHGLDATHMFCLVRTDPAAKPQAGISFLLIDLAQPGVTVRPIVNLGGDVDFCEVFLDDVRAPRANLVGELNQGWTIAKALLGHERLFVGSPKLCRHALGQLEVLAAARGRDGDQAFAARLEDARADVLHLEALYAEFAAVVAAGGEPGADVALLKIWSTETYARLSELLLEAAGRDAGTRGARPCGTETVDVLAHYYGARPAPIYAGTNEIQRNIVARHVLGLPA